MLIAVESGYGCRGCRLTLSWNLGARMLSNIRKPNRTGPRTYRGISRRNGSDDKLLGTLEVGILVIGRGIRHVGQASERNMEESVHMQVNCS